MVTESKFDKLYFKFFCHNIIIYADFMIFHLNGIVFNTDVEYKGYKYI